MSKTIICIIARTVSKRLPLKVLRNVVDNYSLIEYIIEKAKKISPNDNIYLCTSNESIDDILEDICQKTKINIYRGSTDKVIERMIEVGKKTNADNIVRITGDNVFTATEYLPKQISFLNKNNLDYVRLKNLPVGASAEVMSFKALLHCYNNINPKVSEYLLLYMFDPSKYKCGVINCYKNDLSDFTLTVDTKNDYIRTKNIFKKLKHKNPLDIMLNDILEIIYKLDFSRIKPTANIKLPYNKTTTYREFKQDMNERINKSLVKDIS